jgi:hypothetical protein
MNATLYFIAKGIKSVEREREREREIFGVHMEKGKRPKHDQLS